MLKRKLILLGTFITTAPIFLGLTVLVTLNSHLISAYGNEQLVGIPALNNFFRSVQTGTGHVQGAATSDDARVIILNRFYTKYNSPLLTHTEFIVATADRYELDYRLIPAISMQESTGCKFIPHNSYNCWGWGIYGDKVTRFSSYEEGIETVSRGLKRNYVDKGLKTPQQIMAKYTPPALEKGGSWAKGVYYFFDEIEVGTY